MVESMDGIVDMKPSQTNVLISVLVAVYNIEDYIEDCLKSICSQTYSNLEIIVVDDGSTDRSGEICDSFATSDKRVVVYHKSNGGLVSARKHAIDNAHGEYLLQVDGDDSIEADMISKMLVRALETGADVVQCGFECSDGRRYEYSDFTSTLIDENRKSIVEKWLMGTPVYDSQGVTKLCTRDLMKSSYDRVPDECSYSEDWVFFVELLKRATIITSMSECFYMYRIRIGSLSNLSKFDIKYLIDNDRMMNLLYIRIHEMFPMVDENILDEWYLKRRCDTLRFAMKTKYHRDIYRYETDLNAVCRGKSVVIYGAGKIGKDIVSDLSKYEDIRIASWVDKNAGNISVAYRKVDKPEVIGKLEYDYIIIAIADEKRAEAIASEIVDVYRVPLGKVVWRYHRKYGMISL